MCKYQAFFVEVKNLSLLAREQMADIYLAHYEGTSRSLFNTDLDQKSEVLLLYCAGRLVGFTTLQYYDYPWQGQNILIVYSGDTIVEPEHWGQQTLAYAWIRRMGELHKADSDRPIYWFLIVKGHRTYRFMPVFSRTFYPHWSEDRQDLKSLADALARDKYGSAYDADSGIVTFMTSKGHLRPELALPSDVEWGKEAVRYFVKRNPGYINGHELVCLCEISESNMRPLTRRVFAAAHA
jgi:hypothetical protein